MAERPRALPVADADTQPFWDAASAGSLEIPRCRSCQQYSFYPRSVCPFCGSDQLVWTAISGKGTIYSFTVVHRAPDPFREDVPYVVALVDLAEGPRMMTRLIHCAPNECRIGMQVEVEFRKNGPEMSMPYFRPIGR